MRRGVSFELAGERGKNGWHIQHRALQCTAVLEELLSKEVLPSHPPVVTHEIFAVRVKEQTDEHLEAGLQTQLLDGEAELGDIDNPDSEHLLNFNQAPINSGRIVRCDVNSPNGQTAALIGKVAALDRAVSFQSDVTSGADCRTDSQRSGCEEEFALKYTRDVFAGPGCEFAQSSMVD